MTHANTRQRLIATAATAVFSIIGFQVGSALPAVLQSQAAITEAPSTLVLNVSGYDAAEGQILVALFADENSFDAEENPLREAKVSVTGAATVVIFNDLPVGEYAFKLFHDEDSDGKLDTDLLGIPSEAYFFSTDASDPFSAPEWDESTFVLPAGKMTRTINLD